MSDSYGEPGYAPDAGYGYAENDYAEPPGPRNSRLSDLTDLPDWKEPEMGDKWEYREEEHPYASTDFEVPHYINREDFH